SSDGTFNPGCLIITNAKQFRNHWTGVNDQSKKVFACSRSTIEHVSQNCSKDLQKMFFSSVSRDCVATYAEGCKAKQEITNCFYRFLLASEKDPDGLISCVQNKTSECLPVERDAILQVVRELTLVGDDDMRNATVHEEDREDMKEPIKWSNVEKYYGNSTCVCDPALAVHCIFEVHHLSKQDDPDWESLCPLVNKSRICANRFVEGCKKEEQNTVKEIVSKLNYGLRKTCEDPPESECRSIKAMDCVKDLMEYQMDNPEADNITTCVEISKAEKCIENSLKDCEEYTQLKVNRLLAEVIDKWDDLYCDNPEFLLATCSELFEEKVKRILSIDVNLMFSNLELNDTEQYEDFQEVCEEMNTAWECVSTTLKHAKKKGSKIILDSLNGIYLNMEKTCKRQAAPLQCLSCFGQGSKSCATGSSVERCSAGSVCQTVNDQGTVMTRGCAPRTSCKPGCIDEKCTYCCSESECNDIDNGPIAGSCHKQDMAQCIFDLSREFIEDDSFSCSSVELALDCLEHERMHCELGGVSYSLEEISSPSLRAEVQVCLLKEANQSCTIQPITTTASFVSACGMHIDQQSLCGIVADNRLALRLSEKTCTEEETEDIRRNVHAFEDSLGFLDCSAPHGFFLGEECNVFKAMECLEYSAMDIDMDLNKTLPCGRMLSVAKCMDPILEECKPGLYLWPIRQQFKDLMKRANESCEAELEESDRPKDKAVIEIEKCLDGFARALGTSGTLGNVTEAAEQLQACLFELDPELVLGLTSVQRLYLETVTTVIETFVEVNVTSMGDGSASLTPMCSKRINHLVRHHALGALILPLTITKGVPLVCKSLQENVEYAVEDSCEQEIKDGNSYLAEVFELLDMLRDTLIAGFCPNVQPIPRCLVDRAEQCLDRFSAFVGFEDENPSELCDEARALVSCTKSFALTCTDPEMLEQLTTKSVFAMEVITQVCYDDQRLVGEARCSLLRQSKFDGERGCSDTLLSQCAAIGDNSTCTEVEKTLPCFLEGAGECLPKYLEGWTPYTPYLQRMTACRSDTYPDGTPRSLANLFQACNDVPKQCNIPEAAKCLSALASVIKDGANITEGIAVAETCLDKHLYCFSSVITLLSSKMSENSAILLRQLRVIPNWTQMESSLVIRLLNLPSFVLSVLEQPPPVDLNLWNFCWNMDGALSLLKDAAKDFSNIDLPSIKDNTEDLKFSINNLCNNFGTVAEMLQFPQAENPTCAAPAITANINVLMTRSIAEFYTNKQIGAQSVCSLFMSLSASLSAPLKYSPLSLDDCSDGFTAQAHFGMSAVHMMIRSRCEMAQSGGSPRCSIKAVAKCVRRLYDKLMLLGVSQTESDVCNELKQAKQCVERFSFECDDSQMGQVGWMWWSVQRAAERSCTAQRPAAICDKDMDEDPECDIHKAKKCSLEQFRNVINPFARGSNKCKSLSKNIECIQAYTKNCTDSKLPRLFMLDPEDVEEAMEQFKCDMDAMDETFGCRMGCMVDSAQDCMEDFHKKMTRNMWGILTPETCSLINDMRFCVATYTKTCKLKERLGVYRAQDKLLEKFPRHHDACIDVATCTGEFDSLVRQIEGLKAVDTPGYEMKLYGDDVTCDDDMCNEDKKPEEGDKGDGDNEGYDDGNGMKPTKRSLEALCNRIQQLWDTCLQPGLKLLPQEKSTTAMNMYKSIWAVVEEQCNDTRQVSCYMCKNETETEDCEKKVQMCPFDQKACLFHQDNRDGMIMFSAGCANPRSCYNDGNENTQIDCCYGDLCNTPAEVSKTPVQLEPVTCEFEKALMCALDFTMLYISTDDNNCRMSIQRLSCVQRYGQTCTSEAKKALLEATNGVFLELASSSCVIDSDPNDCYSLAIFSMQAILSNAYVNEGNTPCTALEETEKSVKETIANKNCTDAGRVSLESSLAFIRNILGPHCKPGECKAVDWANVINGDGVCSNNIFAGIKNIYQGYAELAKAQPNCRLLNNYVEEAQSLLANCKVVAFLQGKLTMLENQVQQNCGQLITSSLPPICDGKCQTDVVLTYVRELRTALDTASDNNATCVTLKQLERVYNMYTKHCTSVQQRDVVRNAMLKLAKEISYCEENDSSFEFHLDLKQDIYYQVVVCQSDFQDEIAKSFKEGDEERLCLAVKDLEDCKYEIPSVFEEFIMGSTRDLLTLIEDAEFCSDGQNGTATRKKRSSCDISLLSNLIQQLLIPPNIAIASLESRDLYCQETQAFFEQAKTVQEACASSLNMFQKRLFDIMKTTVEKNADKLCVPLRFEEEGCNFKLVQTCFIEFFEVASFATIPLDSLCRQARFALECMTRFTVSCEAADSVKAVMITKVGQITMKNIVANNCPGIVEYLFCSEDLSTISAGCQLEEAQKCAADAKPELSQRFTDGYCESKQEKVDCTKKNLIGCDHQQIKNVSLPTTQLENICGISRNETSLENICRSEPECTAEEIDQCFENFEECSNQANIIRCNQALSSQCKTSFYSALRKIHYLQYYSADTVRCNLSSLYYRESYYLKETCLLNTHEQLNMALLNATGSANQILYQSINVLKRCLGDSEIRRMIDVGAIHQWVSAINDTLDVETSLISG
ncbi:hypothetical protein EGW08_001315, partial [Elysia chlorotica]